MVSFTVNGERRVYEGDPEMPLLWYLRDTLNLKGAKYGCGIGSCGACTVHINGAAQRSCVTTMSTLEGAEIGTIEALGKDGLHPVQQAWIEEDVPQCGYCQTGQIMAAVSLLKTIPNPSDQQIDDTMNNLCRCGTYVRLRKAIHRAAAAMASGEQT